MELSNGMKMLLKRITHSNEDTVERYYQVINKLDIFEPMVQSSEKLGKVPIGRHYIDLNEVPTDFQTLLND